MTNFGTLLSYEQPTKYIVNDTNYKPTYKTPVLTAGKSFILGYTNETDNIFDDLPVIIFDDFTTESKFVDFPFKVKSSAMKILHINQDLVLPKYAFYLMQATEIDHDNHQRYWISTYSQEIISLPPLSEQIKIIETVENLFDLTQSVETNSQNLKNSIKTTKSKILDLAIRGKLVPQDPNDEPASVLLERIRAEKEELIKQGKIKRDKKESVIFKGDDNSYYEKIGDEITCIDDELPFEIPDSWCWARLNCISINYDSYRKPINSYDRKNRVLGKSKDELYPYYGATGQIGFIDDFLFNGEYILLGEDAAPFLDKKAQKAYMIKGKSWVNNHAHILQSLVFPEYLTNCLNSIDYFNYVYGTTRLKLTQENMNRILVPVPSIEEQCKISSTPQFKAWQIFSILSIATYWSLFKRVIMLALTPAFSAS